MYTISVLPIQLSHFFTVDIFLNFFTTASFYHALSFSEKFKIRHVAYAALFFSAAFASKISAIFVLPLILFFIIRPNIFQKAYKAFSYILIFFLFFYFFLRIINPYFFESSNFLNPSISKQFLNNIQTLKSFDNPNVWFPPNVQWIHKTSVFFSALNLILFGLGIPYFLLFLYGVFLLLRKKKLELYLILQ